MIEDNRALAAAMVDCARSVFACFFLHFTNPEFHESSHITTRDHPKRPEHLPRNKIPDRRRKSCARFRFAGVSSLGRLPGSGRARPWIAFTTPLDITPGFCLDVLIIALEFFSPRSPSVSLALL